jgi:hypothetical protein
VREAKHDVGFGDHLSQALDEMYASARRLKYVFHVSRIISSKILICRSLSRKDILRGALTDGHQWILLILYLNKEGGATFKQSEPIYIRTVGLTDHVEVQKPGPDVIAGILSHWVNSL